MKAITILLLILCGPAQALAAGNASGNSFGLAKKELMHLYQDHAETFYAGCRYDKRGHVDPRACGYTPRKNAKRGGKVEWEHIMPAWAFGHSRACWREAICTDSHGKAYKGRRCCERTDALFQAMESDMHNLVPAVGELNGDRSNFRYGMIAGEPRNYGQVDFEVDFKQRVAEPRGRVRGDIARAYFYMEHSYGLRLGKSQRRLLEAWDREDPVDAWEIERNRRIMAIQGNSNPFIDSPRAAAEPLTRPSLTRP